jgi:dienelactone hydrolase
MAAGVFAGEAVTYEVEGAAFEGYMERAADGAPMVLLIHDWDGLTDYEIKRAGMLKDLGYSVFAVDLYGKGVRPTELEDKKKCMTLLTDDRPKMRSYMREALAFAQQQGLNADNCVAMGYCFGGTAVLELARSGELLKGFATFHGGLALPEGQDYSKTQGEVLVMHGTADSMIGMDQFAALANDLEQAGVPHQMISYGGAPHGWTVFGGTAYREKQDQQSWRHFTDFLKEVL